MIIHRERKERSEVMTRAISVYVHIPFCKKICPYCDFCKVFYQEELVDAYLTALDKEIHDTYQNEACKSIYIGGGTPSCLSFSLLERLLQICAQFKKTREIEYTIECNIEDIEEEKIKLFKKYGIHRISIGVQTHLPPFQKKLMRICEEEEIRKKIKLLKENGFHNISLDMMYALPGETLADLQKDLSFFLSLDVPHLSTYSLSIEPHTQFYLQKEKSIDETLDAQMYHFICQTCKKNGYLHYEVSNFAKKGFASKHNLTYWNNEEYYGFGAGAAFYLHQQRGCHTRSLSHYLQEQKISQIENVSREEKMDYFLLLGLRKTKGVSLLDFEKEFHCSLFSTYQIEPWLARGVMKRNETHLWIQESYFYVMNTILASLLNSRKNE